MGRARDGSRDAPAEGEYYIQYGARIERALSEAVDNVIEKGSDDWLGALSSSVWELRLKQQEEELAEAKVKRECCEEAVVSVLVLMDPGQDLDDEMFLVLLNALHERGLVECIGCITTLEPARMRAQLARGTLDVLGLLHVPVGAGSDGGAKGSTEQMESVEYLSDPRNRFIHGHTLAHGCTPDSASHQAPHPELRRMQTHPMHPPCVGGGSAGGSSAGGGSAGPATSVLPTRDAEQSADQCPCPPGSHPPESARGPPPNSKPLMRQGSDGVQGLRASQSHLRAAHDATDGMEVMVGALKEAPDGSVTLMVVASLKDAAQLLHEHEALFLAKIKEVVIQGGVIPWAPDAPTEDRVLQPDAAHNNEFDREASAYVYKRCQECGVPLLVVSRFAAMQVQMPRQIYDELAATGSPVGIHLQKTQASSIERLWTQACAAEGSADRGSLPARCDKAWFVRTFCRGKGAERSGGDRIWDLVVGFNMYDPLALMAVLPCHAHYFSFERVTVDDTTHRVLGMDEERTGINPETKAELVQHLYTAFLQGINGAKRAQHVLQTLETERASARTIAMLREENAELRAQLKPHL